MKKEDALKLAETGLAQLNEELAQGQSETLIRYLDFLARFHRYSFRNALLIEKQCPDASHVAGFHAWRKLGRTVRKGEHGIAILAPLVGRKKNAREEQGTDDEGEPELYGFRVVHVFDVSQTEGKDLPRFAQASGDPGESLGRLERMVAARGITLRYDSMPHGTLGVSMNGIIVVATGLPACATFSVLVHEFAHELLHQGDHRQRMSRTARETEAEATAYVVCRALGLETARRSVDYIHLYRGDAEVLAASLDRVQKTAARILETTGTDTADRQHVCRAA